MASVCLVTNRPFGERALKLSAAFQDFGYEVHKIKHSEVKYPGSQYNDARNSELVIVDCDTRDLSSTPAAIQGHLTRLKNNFNTNSLIVATGTDMGPISEACSETPIFALPTSGPAEGTVKFLQSLTK